MRTYELDRLRFHDLPTLEDAVILADAART